MSRKTEYYPGPLMTQHYHDWTFRSSWPARKDGLVPVTIKKEATRETKFILVPEEEFKRWGWTHVVPDPSVYKQDTDHDASA